MAYTEEANPTILDHEIEARPLGSVKWRCCNRERGQLWRIAAAEACGTAMLILLTCLPGCTPGASDATLLQRSLAAGLVVALIVQCFDHVSGAQLNPTVSLAAALSGKVSSLCAAVMFASQLAGGTLGAALLRLLAPGKVDLCVTRPATYVSIYQALAIETLLGGCLALANLAAWDARNRHLIDSWPLRIGFTVVALSLTAGDLTGASMNPVRSFAPAFVSGDWDTLWIYWVGPLSGSCLCAALYGVTWRASRRSPARDVTPPPSPRRRSPPRAPHPATTTHAPPKLHLSA